ncbi:sigma-70 family RNA polymerase sigma factor [Thalassotalea marina]|uniref:RNA polymerase sigma factor ECF family 11 n=1 Tax=Thalassotalea marina TaxID=1673741 RepID=A0A919BP86_9GAMM|nr:sigma-70 family RNA polymerase sigma factor [Thalassotalea marina]GHG03072.1 RNA polymerase sigma factor ECF family 11 [Thalassotalea marina]
MVQAQMNLPTKPSGVTSKGMKEQVDHRQLSQWLIAVAEQRDRQAFACLFKFFAPKILRIAQSKFNQEAQASEVVQETMSNVWRKAHLFDNAKGAATTWVYTVMRNVTFDMLRKVQSNREDTLSDDFWPIAESVVAEEDTFSDHLEKDKILSCIDELPENQQQVVKGFYFMEMSQEQLAKHLNLPLGTIKSRLRLALAKLRAQLGGKHD